MDTWGALANNVMSRDDLSIRRKTGIVSYPALLKYCKNNLKKKISKKN